MLAQLESALEELRQTDASASSTFRDLELIVQNLKAMIKKQFGGNITFAGRNGVGKSWIMVGLQQPMPYSHHAFCILSC